MTSSKLSVLVVDDDPELRSMLTFDLEMRGAEVRTASGGWEAVRMLKENSSKFDAVISDIRMPEGDGIELLKELSKDDNAPVTVLITGYFDRSIQTAVELGAEAVFTKPFDLPVLIDRVVEAVDFKTNRRTRRAERFEVEYECEIEFLGNSRSNGKMSLLTSNIGVGGMFLGFSPSEGISLPEREELVQFFLKPDLKFLSAIEGTCEVRWIREESSNSGPKGFGVKFCELDSRAKGKVVDLINRLKTKQFDPT